MKYLLYTFVFVVFGSTQLQAQSAFSKHELTGGVGLLSTASFIDVFSNFLVTGLTGGMYQRKNTTYYGNYFAGYKHSLSRKSSLGITYVFNKSEGDVYLSNSKSGKITNTYQTIALEYEYKFRNKPRYQLYSSAGMGVTFSKENYKSNTAPEDINNNTMFNFQMTAIGVKFGSNIGLFAEAGFGYKGLISGGFFAKF